MSEVIRRMLELAESGIMNVIIVKDFSRFGRNSIDAGHYIEQIFPYRIINLCL